MPDDVIQNETHVEGAGHSHQRDLEGPEAQRGEGVEGIVAHGLAARLLSVTHELALLLAAAEDPRPAGGQQHQAEPQELDLQGEQSLSLSFSFPPFLSRFPKAE